MAQRRDIDLRPDQCDDAGGKRAVEGDEIDQRAKSLADDERLVDPDQAEGPAFGKEVAGFGKQSVVDAHAVRRRGGGSTWRLG